MTVKCGQKCTAIRRMIVPEKLIDDVQNALGKALDKVSIGDPQLKEVRMGSLVSKAQVEEVKNRVSEITKTAAIVYGDFDKLNLIGADTKGAFISPMLLREDKPFKI
jgi:oxepin-CoA hydrolase/3-oxo-5,6-dehydrosuberyl-CoA semialdehyde dehydrogenase